MLNVGQSYNSVTKLRVEPMQHQKEKVSMVWSLKKWFRSSDLMAWKIIYLHVYTVFRLHSFIKNIQITKVFWKSLSLFYIHVYLLVYYECYQGFCFYINNGPFSSWQKWIYSSGWRREYKCVKHLRHWRHLWGQAGADPGGYTGWETVSQQIVRTRKGKGMWLFSPVHTGSLLLFLLLKNLQGL